MHHSHFLRSLKLHYCPCSSLSSFDWKASSDQLKYWAKMFTGIPIYTDNSPESRITRGESITTSVRSFSLYFFSFVLSDLFFRHTLKYMSNKILPHGNGFKKIKPLLACQSTFQYLVIFYPSFNGYPITTKFGSWVIWSLIWPLVLL